MLDKDTLLEMIKEQKLVVEKANDQLRKLNELQVKDVEEVTKKEEEIDPRWDKLKQLLTDK